MIYWVSGSSQRSYIYVNDIIFIENSKAYALTNLCKSSCLKIAVLKFTVKTQFTNLCKFTGVEIAVLKFAVKTSIYKPMQIYWY